MEMALLFQNFPSRKMSKNKLFITYGFFRQFPFIYLLPCIEFTHLSL